MQYENLQKLLYRFLLKFGIVIPVRFFPDNFAKISPGSSIIFHEIFPDNLQEIIADFFIPRIPSPRFFFEDSTRNFKESLVQIFSWEASRFYIIFSKDFSNNCLAFCSMNNIDSYNNHDCRDPSGNDLTKKFLSEKNKKFDTIRIMNVLYFLCTVNL